MRQPLRALSLLVGPASHADPAGPAAPTPDCHRLDRGRARTARASTGALRALARAATLALAPGLLTACSDVVPTAPAPAQDAQAPARALAPAAATGQVLEGVGITGVSLGASRAAAEAVLGAPDGCAPAPTVTLGDQPLCVWDVPGGGQLGIQFNERRARKGDPATGAVAIRVTAASYPTTRGVRVGDGDQALSVYGDALRRTSTDLQTPFLFTRDAAGRAVRTDFDVPLRTGVIASITVRYPGL
jgi:hypothetical protein